MRGFDCSDPAHGKVHFTGKDDKDLVQIIKAHAATAHPDLTEGQIREMIAGRTGGRSWPPRARTQARRNPHTTSKRASRGPADSWPARLRCLRGSVLTHHAKAACRVTCHGPTRGARR